MQSAAYPVAGYQNPVSQGAVNIAGLPAGHIQNRIGLLGGDLTYKFGVFGIRTFEHQELAFLRRPAELQVILLKNEGGYSRWGVICCASRVHAKSFFISYRLLGGLRTVSRNGSGLVAASRTSIKVKIGHILVETGCSDAL